MGNTDTRLARERRHARVRKNVKGTSDRPRLCVFRSLKYIYVQAIDDSVGYTMASASTMDPEIRGKLNGKKKVEGAGLIGALIAQRLLNKGIKRVVFDRGGYKYHGRVKALAEAARKAGLEF